MCVRRHRRATPLQTKHLVLATSTGLRHSTLPHDLPYRTPHILPLLPDTAPLPLYKLGGDIMDGRRTTLPTPAIPPSYHMHAYYTGSTRAPAPSTPFLPLSPYTHRRTATILRQDTCVVAITGIRHTEDWNTTAPAAGLPPPPPGRCMYPDARLPHRLLPCAFRYRKSGFIPMTLAFALNLPLLFHSSCIHFVILSSTTTFPLQNACVWLRMRGDVYSIL